MDEFYPRALSILIATIPSRAKSFDRVWYSLCEQTAIRETNGVSVEVLFDLSMEYNIGTKRNKLLQRSKGEYIVFIDDDDEISPNYVSLILKAIESKPDCVAINGIITTNGKDEKKWFISRNFLSWHIKKGVYYRTPNHISPVRRELALKAGFPEIAHGEDYQYSMRLLPMLKTETYIKQPIYHYKYRNDDKK